MERECIAEAMRAGRVRVTDHADEEAAADHLTLNDVFASVENGQVIEEYPTDRPYPSCLLFGMTPREEPVHSVWAFNEESGWAVLVTVYRPDPARWIGWKTRRQRS